MEAEEEEDDEKKMKAAKRKQTVLYQRESERERERPHKLKPDEYNAKHEMRKNHRGEKKCVLNGHI